MFVSFGFPSLLVTGVVCVIVILCIISNVFLGILSS